MGKGDRKTRRGKIYAGSFGKSRPKDDKKDKGSRTPPPAATSAAPARKSPSRR